MCPEYGRVIPVSLKLKLQTAQTVFLLSTVKGDIPNVVVKEKTKQGFPLCWSQILSDGFGNPQIFAMRWRRRSKCNKYY